MSEDIQKDCGCIFCDLAKRGHAMSMSEERKCPACGITLKQITLDRLRDQGTEGFHCLDRDCPPFETWPEVKDVLASP